MVGGEAEPAPRFRLGVDDRGVVRLVWVAGVQITGEAAQEGVRAVNELNVAGARPLFVDMTGTSVVTREARQVFSKPMPSVSRLALVGRSAVDRILANFALGVSGTPMPTRFFTSESAALQWLLDLRSVA